MFTLIPLSILLTMFSMTLRRDSDNRSLKSTINLKSTMSNTKEYFGKADVLEEEGTRGGGRVQWGRLSRRDRWHCSPYIDFLRDGFVAYDFWCHPRHCTGEGHLGAFVTEFLRCAKIWNLYRICVSHQNTLKRNKENIQIISTNTNHDYNWQLRVLPPTL